MQHHNTLGWISALSRPTIPTFAILFTLEPLARSILITVIPLMVFERFGTVQNVSFFYFILGISGVFMSLAIPWLVSKIDRRGIFNVGAVIGVVAMILFMQGEIWSLCAGMILHLFASSCIEVSLNLYMMRHIRRENFSFFEPIRVFFLAFSWSVGPFLGVYLRNAISLEAPFLFGVITTLVLTAYFFYLRFTDHLDTLTTRHSVTNPLKYLPRFFQQPRLRLAYFLSFMRSGWWTMYFIYVPIYCVTSGLGETFGGGLVSLATAFVMTTPLWRRPIHWLGMRTVLFIGFFCAGVMTIVISLFMDNPYLAIGIIMAAAFFAVPCDAVGNAPFYRSVHSYERSEMTTVFVSYRSIASLTLPGLYSGVLAIFQLPAVFAVTGMCMIGTSLVTRYIPKSMN